MEVIVYEMAYSEKEIPESSAICIPFDETYFPEYMKIYNECFYEMRKSLDIQPYNFLSDYDQIKDKVQDIFLLIENNGIIGSVACYGNEIDDLIVNQRYQRKGYGKQLLLWGMNRIRLSNDKPITLHVAKWNENAVSLYEKVGFKVIKTEQVK